MNSRVFSFRAPGAIDLKNAGALLIDRVGGLSKASEACRLNVSSLSDCINPEKTTRYLPVDVVLQLEHAANASMVTMYLASRQGFYICQPIPKQLGLTDVVRETGELLGVVGMTLSDPNYSRSILIKELEDALGALASLHSSLINRVVRNDI